MQGPPSTTATLVASAMGREGLHICGPLCQEEGVHIGLCVGRGTQGPLCQEEGVHRGLCVRRKGYTWASVSGGRATHGPLCQEEGTEAVTIDGQCMRRLLLMGSV
eukprot:366489-Chlamydomonas_euryale.AAC.10